MDRNAQANYILYDLGLLSELSNYGTPHIIGSFKMNLMAWNDLDIDVENDSMSLDELHRLTKFILDKFNPTWYEAKEQINDSGGKVWFHGYEFYLNGELWNIDIWFLDPVTIKNAESYCDDIYRRTHENNFLRDAIIRLKQDLINKNLYSFEKYTSIDVYDAVLNKGITNTDDFLKNKAFNNGEK